MGLSSCNGFNDRVGRYRLWSDLRCTSRSDNGLPWLIMGDFNIVGRQERRLGGNPVNRAEVDDFNECIHDIQDMVYG